MNTRLKTSKNADTLLTELNQTLKLSTKAAVARLGISLVLSQEKKPSEFITYDLDQGGFEFQRHTLTGDNDDVTKALIIQHYGESIIDEDYFPTIFVSYLEGGLELLRRELKYYGSKERLFKHLINVTKRNMKVI